MIGCCKELPAQTVCTRGISPTAPSSHLPKATDMLTCNGSQKLHGADPKEYSLESQRRGETTGVTGHVRHGFTEHDSVWCLLLVSARLPVSRGSVAQETRRQRYHSRFSFRDLCHVSNGARASMPDTISQLPLHGFLVRS